MDNVLQTHLYSFLPIYKLKFLNKHFQKTTCIFLGTQLKTKVGACVKTTLVFWGREKATKKIFIV
jgi:hypothetical protein